MVKIRANLSSSFSKVRTLGSRSPRRDQKKRLKVSERGSRKTKAMNIPKETIIIITITIGRTVVVYGKTSLAPLQSGAGAAAAVEGTVWSPHPKAGLFSSCVCCVQGRLIELMTWGNISRANYEEAFFKEDREST